MKKFSFFVGLIFSSMTFGQFNCPGNLWTNGEVLTPSAVATGFPSNNINLANGYTGLRTASTQADIHGSASSPITGNAACAWITSGTSLGLLYREGFKNELVSPLSATSTYQLNFDYTPRFGWGHGDVRVGIYGCNIPSGTYNNSQVGVHNPTNLALFGAGNTVLLGFIDIPASSVTSGMPIVNYALTFNPSSLGFNSNITSIMITNTEDEIPGKRFVYFDNFCLTLVSPPPPAYCCENPNLLINGAFEMGNTGFTSAYANQTTISANSVLPGEYAVINDASALGISPSWDVRDHTNCVLGYNDQVMVVNGRTQQPSGTAALIYSQDILNVHMGTKHIFCLNAKNMSQCTFNVDSRFYVEILGGTWLPSSPYQGGIFTLAQLSGPCDWQLFGGMFGTTNPNITFNIYLMEDGNGDGNDFAFDDIFVGELVNCHLDMEPYGEFGKAKSESIENHPTFYTESVIVSPNPSKDKFMVQLEDVKSGTIKITDLSGREVVNLDFSNQKEIECDLSFHEKGNYILHIVYEGKTVVKNIIRE